MATGNLNTVLPTDKQGDVEAQQSRIASAYGALFSGNGTKDDADIVLVDLALFSRYYDTATMTDTPAALAAATQRRAVMQRIMDAMAISGREPQGLLSAVLGSPPITEKTEENVS
jgi:hypothetical protein